MTNPLDHVAEVVRTTEPGTAWLGVLTALALYGGKKLLDALLPKGYVFRVMDRFMSQRRNDERSTREDEDDG